MHSATELKCLTHLVHFFNYDARLLVYVDPGAAYAVINFPLKRAHSTHLVPPGVTDNCGVAAYELWAEKMLVDYSNSNLSILESVNALDLSELKSLAFYPLQYVNGTNAKESYVLVFIPGYRHRQENWEEIDCRAYRLGYLLFGR